MSSVPKIADVAFGRTRVQLPPLISSASFEASGEDVDAFDFGQYDGGNNANIIFLPDSQDPTAVISIAP